MGRAVGCCVASVFTRPVTGRLAPHRRRYPPLPLTAGSPCAGKQEPWLGTGAFVVTKSETRWFSALTSAARTDTSGYVGLDMDMQNDLCVIMGDGPEVRPQLTRSDCCAPLNTLKQYLQNFGRRQRRLHGTEQNLFCVNFVV